MIENKELKEEIMTIEKQIRNKEKLEIAKKMKRKGADIDFIVEVTGLSKEEVEKL